MSHSNERGAAERGMRSSALWGTGSRGGDSRSSVLWGKGGRGIVATCIAVCALGAPLAAMASPGNGKGNGTTTTTTTTTTAPLAVASSSGPGSGSYVDKGLLKKAKDHPGNKVRVIIQSALGVDGASKAFKGLGSPGSEKRLGLVNG